MANSTEVDYRKVIDNEPSLMLFLRNLRKFDTEFCRLMTGNNDFTLRLEVHGNANEILHVRVYTDEIERPRGVEKRIEKKG